MSTVVWADSLFCARAIFPEMDRSCLRFRSLLSADWEIRLSADTLPFLFRQPSRTSSVKIRAISAAEYSPAGSNQAESQLHIPETARAIMGTFISLKTPSSMPCIKTRRGLPRLPKEGRMIFIKWEAWDREKI